MTRSDLHKEKHGNKIQLPEDDILDGTSARTRPLSFDDIILRRKNKGDSAKQISIVTDSGSAQDNTVTASDFPECHHQINDDSEPMDEKNNPNYLRSERKGKTHSSRKNDKFVQVNDEGSLDPDAKPKMGAKNASSNIVSGGKYEREKHRKKVDLLNIDSINEPDKRKDRDSYKKDRHSERCRVKSEIVKNQQQNEEREVYRKRKPDGRMSSDSDSEHKKRNVKDERQTEKLTSRGKEKPKKETRHKRHHEEDKTRGRSSAKKNDTEKKGSETQRTYLEESGPKRRRSRSRERDKDRGRRSRSQSPKSYKHTSKEGRELGELQPSHSTKDRSGREHSDVDKKRISSNGSGSHYRRNTNSSSGLGGYSPRKRKTEAAAKTPSPTHRSPDKRSAGWDFQNVEKESNKAASTVSYMNTSSQSLSLNVKELHSVSLVTTTAVKPIGISLQALSSQMHAIEAIQLTQATRPMRRLYVENLPASASEEYLKECINKLLLSSGVNYVQGTQPCISSIIHKEKNQALLEFLTPEDASAALSFDGMSFSGSSLKIRRPKDYTIGTTPGLSDKLVGTVDSVSGVVEDSPNKIFIGGISKLYSSRMLLEIARAFGVVKSFHFEFIADFNESCAFLEYVDHSVTSKACAGLNGMRLGGQVLTAVPAKPEPVLDNAGKHPIYGIPEHVKPLLEKPTTVVKLNNMLDPECLISLSESEAEDMLQDIKLECSRFGTVKSINVSKTSSNSLATMEAYEVKNTSTCSSYTAEQLREISNELENNCQTLADRNGCDDSSGISEPKDVNEIKLLGDSLPDKTTDETCINASVEEEPLSHENPTGEFSKLQDDSGDFEMEDKVDGDKKEGSLGDCCVYVEYTREEAACMAAHCLHGRTFDGRIVSVEYVGHDLYHMRFRG